MTRITVTGWPPLCDLWFALSSSALRMWYVVFDLGDKCCWNEIFAVALSFLLCSWKVEVLVTQSCLTLCDPMYCSPPGSSVHEFSRQEYQRGSSPGIKPGSRIADRLFTIWVTREALYSYPHLFSEDLSPVLYSFSQSDFSRYQLEN